jgi:exonuclease SbcC
MLQSLEIQNFQSHKFTKLDFDPGVNVIIGSSDSGKSAILRTLRWLAWNRPSGDTLRSWWGGKTFVKATLDNGTVERSKDKAEEYVLNDSLTLKAFGLSVPEDVSKLLNLSEINLQAQLDAPFLLSSTPGEVALHFNKVAGLDKIDKSQQNVEREIRELNSYIGKTKKDGKPGTGLLGEKERLTEQLEDYEYLEKYEIELEVLETMEKQKTSLEKALSKLIVSFNNIVDVHNELDDISEIVKLEKKVLHTQSLIDKKRQIDSEVKKITNIVIRHSTIENEIYSYELQMAIEPMVLSLSELIENRKIKSLPFTSLNKLVKSFKGVNLSLKEESEDLTLKIEKFKREMPEECPLCGEIKKIV